MTDSRDLVVIEAPGKRDVVQAALAPLALNHPKVIATRGMLLDLPRRTMGLDPATLAPTHYEPTRAETHAALTQALARAGRVWIMTDADREGEVIAAQIQYLAAGRPCHRVRCTVLEPARIQAAFRAAGALDSRLATQGVARRIVDRVIGYGYSNPRLPGAVGIVGRVLTGTLVALRRTPPPAAQFEGRTENGLELVGHVTHENYEAGKAVLGLLKREPETLARLPMTEERLEVSPPPPLTAATGLLLVSKWLDQPIDKTAEDFQRLYEQGLMSYGRTDSAHLGARTRSRAAEMLRGAGGIQLANDWRERYLEAEDDAQGAHEALHPAEPLGLADEPLHLNHDKAILNIVGRRLAASLAAPATVMRKSIDRAALRTFVQQKTGIDIDAQGLVLSVHRTRWGRANAWRRMITPPAPEAPALVPVPQDRMLLRAMLETGLGRPSTYVEHAATIQRRGFISPRGALTPAGRKALEYAEQTAPVLLDPARLARFEPALETEAAEEQPPHILAQRVLDALGVKAGDARALVEHYTPPAGTDTGPPSAAPAPEAAAAQPA